MKNKFLFAILLFIFLAPSVHAQTADTSIVIQPSTTEITVSPNQKIAKTFSIINRSNFSVTLNLVVKDYRQVSQNGKLEFYDATSQQASTWLIPQFLQIGLKPLETKDIGFVVSVPKDFSGGGHYGAIVFQPADNNSVNVNTANNFGELVLLTVTGSNVKSAATIKSVNLSTGSIQPGNSVDFNFKMQNTGNTQFDTQGKLVLKDWLGKEIGNYNVGQLIVYPGTSRLFQWRWNGVPAMGLYNASVMLTNPGISNKFNSVDGIWFIIFPWQAFLAILLAMGLVFVLVKYRKEIFLRMREIFWRRNENPVSIPVKKISAK